jgi:hypothetical protein
MDNPSAESLNMLPNTSNPSSTKLARNEMPASFHLNRETPGRCGENRLSSSPHLILEKASHPWSHLSRMKLVLKVAILASLANPFSLMLR